MSTVTIKTKDLCGPALDWAVAKAVGVRVRLSKCVLGTFCEVLEDSTGSEYEPSTNWAQGGPLLERHQVIYRHSTDGFETCVMTGAIGVNRKRTAIQSGRTILESACRSIAASKLGSSVSVPAELAEAQS